jgi:hypothetical protein
VNITYIFKHFLPRKAKEKENKFFSQGIIDGVLLGDINCLSLFHFFG